MSDWTLEQIETQAARGGVNRQQADWLLMRVAQLEDAIFVHRHVVEEDPDFDVTYHADERLWSHLDD